MPAIKITYAPTSKRSPAKRTNNNTVESITQQRINLSVRSGLFNASRIELSSEHIPTHNMMTDNVIRNNDNNGRKYLVGARGSKTADRSNEQFVVTTSTNQIKNSDKTNNTEIIQTITRPVTTVVDFSSVMPFTLFDVYNMNSDINEAERMYVESNNSKGSESIGML